VTTFAEAFIRLKVDPRDLRKEITSNVESAASGVSKSGEKAGASWAAGFGSKISGVADKVLKVTALGAVGLGVEGVRAASKFNSEMELLATQAGVAQNQIGGLSKGVLQLAGQVGFSPDSLAESLFHIESNFASLGITGPRALNLVKIAAKGAAVGHADLVDVTNALGAAEASGIKGVKNFSQAMGVLNATVGSGDMHMQDLAEAFGTGVLASVKQFGINITDVGAALAVYGDNNIRGAHAGTQLRMAVMALAAPSKAGVKTLQALGIQSGQLAEDMRKGGLKLALEDLVSKMHKAGVTSDQVGQIITTAFGKKAGVGLSILVGQMDRFESKYPALRKGATDFGTAWARTQQQAAQQWKQLVAGSQAFVIQVGQKLLPIALTVLQFVQHNHTAVIALTIGIVALSVVIKISVVLWNLWTAAVKFCNTWTILTRIELVALRVQIIAVSVAQKIATAAQGIWTAAMLYGSQVVTAVKDSAIVLRVQTIALAVAQRVAAVAQAAWTAAMAFGKALALAYYEGLGLMKLQTVAVAAAQKIAAIAQGVWTAAMAFGLGVVTAVRDAQIGMRIALVALAAQQYVVAAASKIAAAAQWLWNVAMDANPIGIVILAIGLLVGAVIYAYTHFSWFRKIVQDVWGWIKNNWPLLAGILTLGIAPFIVFIVRHWGDITDAVSASIKWIRHAFADFVNFLLGVWQNVIQGAADAFGWIPGIGGKLRTAAAAFAKFRVDVTDAIAGIQGKQVSVGVNLSIGGGGVHVVPGVATGGLIRGPGTGTSDTAGVFALSNKEYVHNAAAVAHYGVAWMDAVNQKRIPKMAAGGLALSTALPSQPAIQAAVVPPLDAIVKMAVSQMKVGGSWNPIVGIAMAAVAEQFVGRLRYVWGGTSLSTGADCSGFTMRIMEMFGFSPPRVAAAQQAWATPSRDAMGVLAFFAGADGTAKNAGHVGFSLGDGRYVSEYAPPWGTAIMPMVGSSGGFGGFGIPPGGSFRHGGVLTEPIAGIGLKSGRGYQFHAPEVVTSERGLADLAGLLAELIEAVEQNSSDTGDAVAAALGGIARDASYRGAYSPR
jgi:TP901 family phage tail tape measure protein